MHLGITFKDRAKAQAPLFLKWFQLKSRCPMVSLPAEEKDASNE